MPGQAIFSNIESVIYGRTNQTYNRIVKRFGKELKRQKIIPTVRAGYVKNFVESEITTEQKLKAMFNTSWDLRDFEYAEITIFTWE